MISTGYLTPGIGMWRSALLMLLWAISGSMVFGQGVLMGPTDAPPHSSALLHLNADPLPPDAKKGMLPPNVALTRTDEPGPVGPLPLPPSLLVYNTAITTLTGVDAQYNVFPGLYSWDGARWLRFEAGVGRQLYVNCSSGNLNVPYQATFQNSNASFIPGVQSNSNLLNLQRNDRVFLEATGAVQLLAGTENSDRYTDVVVELVYATSNTTTPTGILARTVFSLDTRMAPATSNSFFFGLFSSSASGFQQHSAIQNWSLSAHLDVTVTATSYRFWVRVRKTRNVAGTNGVTTGAPGTVLETCLRTEVFRY